MNVANPKLIEIIEQATEWRRQLHQHPQTCYEEEFARDFIVQKLTEFGVDTDVGLAKTGVVGTLSGKQEGTKQIGLRADIDALNILEENDFEYKSKIKGKMHACGHDGHTAMLLAAAKYLAETRNFGGKVHFIFQPAEEGGAGGERMIKEGLFDKFPCSSVWGMHNIPGIAVGDVMVKSGVMMASVDEFSVTIRGKGGHAAIPQHTIDPILVASHIITALHSIVSRNVKPTDAAVISITKVEGGSAVNIIPDEVSLLGTIRTLNPKVQKTALENTKRISESIAKSFGAEAIWRHGDDPYPVLINSEKETLFAEQLAKHVANNVGRLEEPIMGGEDFAFMLQEKPGTYIFLGNGEFGQKGGQQLHTCRYDFNDDAILYGVNYWIKLVETLLND